MTPAETGSNVQGTLAKVRPGVAFVVMIFGALVAFEIFNFSTTEHALKDLLGDLTFASLPWSSILAVAFCGIDFAGIARLFTPEQGMNNESKEVWYLFGAWLLAATMNAILTWWGVSIAVVGHAAGTNSIVDPETLTGVVPVFVAIMVWVIRILIIGTLSLAMDRLLHPAGDARAFQAAASGRAAAPARPRTNAGIPSGLGGTGFPTTRPTAARQASAAPRSAAMDEGDPFEPGGQAVRPEPTYHSMSGRQASGTTTGDRFRRS